MYSQLWAARLEGVISTKVQLTCMSIWFLHPTMIYLNQEVPKICWSLYVCIVKFNVHQMWYFRTQKGQKCFPWSDHPSHYGHYDHNHCRNPIDKSQPTKPQSEEWGPGSNVTGVWCFTGKGDSWEYCSVPKCEDLENLSIEEAAKKISAPFVRIVLSSDQENGHLALGQQEHEDKNVTIAEKGDYQVILTACIILMSVNFFLVIIIFTITISWCRERCSQKEITEEENEMEGF